MSTHRTIRAAIGAGALAAAALAAPAHALTGHDTQPLITIGTGTALHVLPWQACASDAVLGAGLLASVHSPNTQQGGCLNSAAAIRHGQPGLISVLDGSAVNVAPWQFCGSNVVAGLGAAVVSGSPKTVHGDCHNAATDIAAAGAHRPSLLSVLSGSSVNALPWQVCGSTAVAGLGVLAAADSPTTVHGDCTNAVTRLAPTHPGTLLPLLSGVPLTALPLQTCGQATPLAPVGVAVPVRSPATVTGRCTTGGTAGS